MKRFQQQELEMGILNTPQFDYSIVFIFQHTIERCRAI